MIDFNAQKKPLIRLENVSKTYRRAGLETRAVQDVTFDVNEGDFLSIVGASGCGKTTVLKILAGLQQATGGTIAFNGLTEGRDVGMVFQQPLLLKWRTIRENVLLPAQILGLDGSKAKARADDLLDMVGLGHAADRYPYELSGGMQQRAAIARALLHDPKLVVMDEPFGALDAITREKMNLEMLRIRKDTGKTFIFVTHDIQEAVFLGSAVAVLTSGPARMADYFAIALPGERGLNIKLTQPFAVYVDRIYGLLGLR